VPTYTPTFLQSHNAAFTTSDRTTVWESHQPTISIAFHAAFRWSKFTTFRATEHATNGGSDRAA
jgi:hypothetical protein